VASAVNLAMAELMGQTASNTDLDDIDADGEYEMDDVEYAQPPVAQPVSDAHGHTTDAEGSDVDAEGEEVDEEEEDDAEPVGDVKIARRPSVSDEEDDYDAEDAAKESSDAKSSDSDDSTNADSEEENQWQASEDGDEDELVKSSNPNVCMSVLL
jgi:histone acetyltransferase SAS3